MFDQTRSLLFRNISLLVVWFQASRHMYSSAVYFAALKQVDPGPYEIRHELVWLPCVGKATAVTQ